MGNRILDGRASKISDSGGNVVSWSFIYEFCRAADSPVDEAMTGAADGVNAVFTTVKNDLVKADGNVAVAADVSVKVAGVAATVSSIDPATGDVTLSAAPASGAAVVATYKYTDLSDHREIVIEATEMTLATDSAEAKTKANTKATTARTDWLTALDESVII